MITGDVRPGRRATARAEGIPGPLGQFCEHVRTSPNRSCGIFVFLAAMVVPVFAAELPQASPPPAPTKVVRSPGNAEWASTPDEARTLAAAQKKLVFYEFDQSKCGKCRRMDQLLYPAFEFEALLIPMVPVKVMIDSADGKRLAGRYGIEEVPAILVTTPQGRLAFQMQGFVNAQDFYPHIHKDLDAYRIFSKKIDAQDVPRLPAQAALDAGRELYRLSDPAAAQPRLARAISAPNAPAPVRDEAREILAAVEQDLGHLAASRETIERLIATSRDPDRLERAELFRAQLSLAENKPADAYALFQKFQKDHPQSAYRSQVDALIARVEASLPK